MTYGKTHRWLVLAVLCVSAVLVDYPRAFAEPETLPYQKQVDAERYEQAEAMLQQMLKNKRLKAEVRWTLVVDLAKVQRLRGAPKRALDTLETLSETDRDRPRAALELARCQLATGEKTTGLGLLRLLKNNASPEIKFQANHELAQIEFDEERFQPCIDLAEQAIRDYRGIDFYHNPHEAELRAMQAEVQRLLMSAKDRVIAQRYGEDYAAYRRGRHAQAQHQDEDAIEAYRSVKAPILADASGCYIPQVLERMGLVSEAAKRYKQFIEDDEFGLYRGEAMLRLGHLRLTHGVSRQDLETAGSHFQQVLDWISEVERRQLLLSTDSIRAVTRDFPPPAKLVTANALGNYHRHYATPDTIVNRATCSWYLPQLRLEATLSKAFVLNELGETEASIATLREALKLNSTSGGHLMNHRGMPDRLIWEARDGSYLLPERAWKALSPKNRVSLRLAYFYLTGGEHGKAATLFRSVLTPSPEQSATVHDLAAADFGMAVIHFREMREAPAVEILKRFDTAYTQSPLLPLAKIMEANIYAGWPDGYEPATELYTSVARAFRKTEYAPRALLSLAVCAANRDDGEQAIIACERLLKDHGSSRFSPAASALLRRLQSSDITYTFSGVNGSAESASTDHKDTGGTISFARHMVIPGDGGAPFSFDITHADDLIAYSLSYSIRAGCYVQNFRLWLTEFEPQIVPTDRNKEIGFIRVPALFL